MVHFHSPLLNRMPHNKDVRRRTLIFRAPSVELKAVWQNLIQRQLIKINTTGHSITPLTSPVESPNQLATDSLATLGTPSIAHKCQQTDIHINDLIDYRCRQLGKCTGKGRAYHLSQWMKGELDNNETSCQQVDSEPEVEIWSEEDLRLRTAQLQNVNCPPTSKDELAVVYVNLSRSTSVSSLATPPEIIPEAPPEVAQVPVCQKCHSTCLRSPKKSSCSETAIVDAFLDNRNHLQVTEVTHNSCTLLSPVDPFNPLIPDISVTPPDSPPFHEMKTTTNSCCEYQDENINMEPVARKTAVNDLTEEHSPALKKYASFCDISCLPDDVPFEKTDAHNIISASKDAGVNISWTNRASSLMANKLTFFENNGDSINTSLTCSERHRELQCTNRTLVFEDEAENSGGTSGDEFWGTPNSGAASVASNECGVLSPSSLGDEDENAEVEEEHYALSEEMIVHRQTTVLSQHNSTPSRLLAAKSRLEPLPEDEEEEGAASSSTPISLKSGSSSSVATSNGECTVSCPVIQENSVNGFIRNGHRDNENSYTHNIFDRFKLQRTKSAGGSDIRINRKSKKNEPYWPQKNDCKKSKFLKIFRRALSDDSENYGSDDDKTTTRLYRQDNENEEKTFWNYLKSKNKTK